MTPAGVTSTILSATEDTNCWSWEQKRITSGKAISPLFRAVMDSRSRWLVGSSDTRNRSFPRTPGYARSLYPPRGCRTDSGSGGRGRGRRSMRLSRLEPFGFGAVYFDCPICPVGTMHGQVVLHKKSSPIPWGAFKSIFSPFSVAVLSGNLDENVVQANHESGKSVHEFFLRSDP